MAEIGRNITFVCNPAGYNVVHLASEVQLEFSTIEI